MKIEYQIKEKEYIKLMLFMYYRKPISIILLIMGMIILFFTLRDFISGRIFYLNYSSVFLNFFMIAMIFIIYPIIIYQRNKKHFKTNRIIGLKTVTEFTEEKFSDTAESLYAEVEWKNIYKIEELKSWFLFYHSSSSFGFCPKRSFTNDQIIELRRIILKNNIKAKLQKD